MKYTSDIEPKGKLIAATNDGRVIYQRKHLYIKKKNKVWLTIK